MVSTSYTTPVSRASALSKKLLSRSQVERMLASETAKEAFRILYDLSWAPVASDASGVDDFENIITAGLYEIKKTILSSIGESPLANLLLLPFDLQNAKTSLAAFAKGKEYEEFRKDLSPLALFPRKTAFSFLSGKGGPLLAKFFEDALQKGKKIIENNTENIQHAEEILDALFFQKIESAAKQAKSTIIYSTIQKQIDAENIKKVVRSQKESTVLFLSPQSSAGYEILSREDAQSKLAFSEMKPALDEGLSLISEGKSLAEWEIQIDLNIIGSLFWTARTNPLGGENILLLFLTKLRNAEIIRTILVGKRNGFSEEEIREMVAIFLPFLPAS